jgi:hypothetical protein
LPAERRRKRRRWADPFDDGQGRRLVEIETAVSFRYGDAEQSELAAPLEERTRELPVLLLQSIEHRKHFRIDELRRRLGHEAMLVTELLGCEDVRRLGLLEEPRAAPEMGSGVI